jgi:hypothetical protein
MKEKSELQLLDDMADIYVPIRSHKWGGRHQQAKCKRGHPMSGDNLMPMAAGGYRCRACKEAWERAHYPSPKSQLKFNKYLTSLGLTREQIEKAWRFARPHRRSKKNAPP